MADAQELLKQAILATKKRQLPAARKLIQASIRKDPDNAMAWLVYASIAENKRGKLLCLKRALELDPESGPARKMVQEMGIDPEELLGKKPAAKPETPPPASGLFSFAQDEPEAEAADDPPDYLSYSEEIVAPPPEEAEEEALQEALETAPPKAGIVPRFEERPPTFEARLEQSIAQADQIVGAYLTPPPSPDGITWVKKDQNRAGENEILLVRAAVATSLITFVAVPLVIIGVILWNTPFVQALVDPDEEFVSLIRTLTPTPTPPTTPTNTPGFTPTPSITPTAIPENAAVPTLTPTPTVFSFLRAGNPDINVFEPTTIFVPGGVADRAVIDGLRLIDEGQPEAAIPTLEFEREANITTFDALVYYTEAVAKARAGEVEDALELLEEGEVEREERTRPEETLPRAAIQAGFAEVYMEQGRRAQAAGNTGGAAQSFALAERRAQEAIELQPDWAEPRLALIESYVQRGNYNAALSAIDEAQEIQAFQDDVRFIVQRGEIYFRQEDYVNADYQAFTALYVDPFSAEAHDLQTRIALAREDASNASLYAQAYLYYHPLVVRGWEMLGAARMMEGNTNLALEAYTQAITVGENTDGPLAIRAYISRANIYERRGQYEQALADIAAAAEATDNPDYQRRQLDLTVKAGLYTEARELAETLLEEDVITPGTANLTEARVLLATRESPTAGDYAEIAQLIDSNFASIPVEEQPLANTIRAEAYLGQDNPQSALNFAQQALNAGETAPLRLLLGDIYTALEQPGAALAEYRRVVTLHQLVGVPDEIVNAAQNGIAEAENALARQQADATATAQAR